MEQAAARARRTSMSLGPLCKSTRYAQGVLHDGRALAVFASERQKCAHLDSTCKRIHDQARSAHFQGSAAGHEH